MHWNHPPTHCKLAVLGMYDDSVVSYAFCRSGVPSSSLLLILLYWQSINVYDGYYYYYHHTSKYYH